VAELGLGLALHFSDLEVTFSTRTKWFQRPRRHPQITPALGFSLPVCGFVMTFD